MKQIVKIIVCAIVALTLTGVLLALLIPSRGEALVDNLNLGSVFYDESDYTVVDDGELRFLDAIDKIEIEWASGNVVFQTSDEESITIRESGAGSDDERMRWRLEDGKLVIRERASGLNVSTLHKTLEVWIPESMRTLELEINVASADVRLEPIALEELEVNSASGNLTADLSDIGEIKFDSASGNCTLTYCVATSVEINTVSGECNLNGNFEMIDVDTTSGNFELCTDLAPVELEVDGVSADVCLRLPADTEFTAKLDSVSGDIGITGFAVSGGRNSYVCGNGGNRFRFESVSGDVEIIAR